MRLLSEKLHFKTEHLKMLPPKNSVMQVYFFFLSFKALHIKMKQYFICAAPSWYAASLLCGD